MDTKKAALLLAIIGLVIVLAMAGVLILTPPDTDNTEDTEESSEQAEVSFSLDGDILTVSVESMNDSEEVTVSVGGEGERTLDEPGMITTEVEDGQSVTVTDDMGVISEKVVSLSGDSDSDDDDTIEDDTQEEDEFSLEGEGTEESPYEISTVSDLQVIQQKPDAHYVIVSDIDATNTKDWNDGAGFEPIDEFTGTLDGQNHVIHNLVIYRPEDSRVGMFRRTNGAIIKRVKLTGVEIEGKQQVGGIAGSMKSTTVRSVEVSGFISGEQDVGMIAGITDDETTIE